MAGFGTRRRLLAKRRFVPWGCKSPPLQFNRPPVSVPDLLSPKSEDEEEVVVEPLVLYEPDEEAVAKGESRVEVDKMLTRWLRPHQREGVQFLFDCT